MEKIVCVLRTKSPKNMTLFYSVNKIAAASKAWFQGRECSVPRKGRECVTRYKNKRAKKNTSNFYHSIGNFRARWTPVFSFNVCHLVYHCWKIFCRKTGSVNFKHNGKFLHVLGFSLHFQRQNHSFTVTGGKIIALGYH